MDDIAFTESLRSVNPYRRGELGSPHLTAVMVNWD